MTTSATDAKTLLKYANLQMAAEAFLSDKEAGVGEKIRGLIDPLKLTKGNDRSSKFTDTQAAEFVKDWEVVEHIGNTATGFSGTLFRCKETDSTRGLEAGELVLSFRSTEFLDDAARDNQATNTMEIKTFGWAFGQIADMEKWYASLKTRYASEFTAAQNKLSVTNFAEAVPLAIPPLTMNSVAARAYFIWANGLFGTQNTHPSRTQAAPNPPACTRVRQRAAQGSKYYQNKSCSRIFHAGYSPKTP